MFLQVSVCPQGGGGMRGWRGCMCGCQGACMVVWLQGACVVAGGHVWLWGCVWLWGACMVAGGHVWLQGACLVVGGMHSCRGVCMVAGGHA